MTTTTTPHPDVPLPPGAEISLNWRQWDHEGRERILRGRERSVSGHEAEVVTHAKQGRDGRITEPCIGIFLDRNDDFSSDSARELARLLLEGADELDGWAAK